jgi:hypothetical protein
MWIWLDCICLAQDRVQTAFFINRDSLREKNSFSAGICDWTERKLGFRDGFCCSVGTKCMECFVFQLQQYHFQYHVKHPSKAILKTNNSVVVVEITNNMHIVAPLLYSICWLLHVSAVVCHLQGAPGSVWVTWKYRSIWWYIMFVNWLVWPSVVVPAVALPSWPSWEAQNITALDSNPVQGTLVRCGAAVSSQSSMTSVGVVGPSHVAERNKVRTLGGVSIFVCEYVCVCACVRARKSALGVPRCAVGSLPGLFGRCKVHLWHKCNTKLGKQLIQFLYRLANISRHDGYVWSRHTGTQVINFLDRETKIVRPRVITLPLHQNSGSGFA